jgi:hypothetical protein
MNTTRLYRLVVGSLAVWRVTHLLQAEDGPLDIVVRFRRLAGGGFWGQLLDCFYCLSLWVSAPLSWLLGEGWVERLLMWPALSTGAIMIERLTEREDGASPALYYEDPEEFDGLLR